MILHGDEAQVKDRFSPSWRKMGARFAPNIPKAQKSFLTNLMVLLGDEAQVEDW
jgi:hypothetical protein